jgi:RNA polymerase sigma-70 factor, ECF subfamily
MGWKQEDFTEIFNDLYPRLRRFLVGILGSNYAAQDIAQEALLRLYRLGADKIPRDETHFWVFRVARNLAHNELKKKQTHIKLLGRIRGIFSKLEPNPEEKMVTAEESSLIVSLVDTLSEDQRTALLLREWEEMSYRDIARIMGVSEHKVKIDIFRARKLLRERWRENSGVKQHQKRDKYGM